MNSITESYLTRAEIWLFITTLAYFLMNGAQIFETAVMVPKWTADPPETLRILADKNGASLKTFWIILHSIHEITFILAIAFCWKLDIVRNWLLILLVLHFAVRVWTLVYFAPNIIGFEKMAGTPGSGAELLRKVNLWKSLNYLRVGIYLAISFGLIPLCVKVLNLNRT
jgi:hypothetical protein